MIARLLVCGAMGGMRLVELAWSRRNLEGTTPATEGPHSRDAYPLIVAVHTVTIIGTALRGSRPRAAWLALLFAVQPLRAWVLMTLGRRWNARGAVPDGLAIETGGPYRYVRHPNYLVVVVELAALPLAFGLWRLAIVVSALNALLLAMRINDEEKLLARHAAWREHFAGRKRLLPGVY